MPVDVGGKILSLLKVPNSPEILESIVSERGLSEEKWPYWLEEWPATFALGAYLFKNWKTPPRRILDLGCGSGFLGLLFLEMGSSLLACDFNQDACRLAALNIRSRGNQPKVFAADLKRFPSRAEFDLILVGELLYSRENLFPILEFLSRHLHADGQAILCDAGRSSAETFAASARDKGFRLNKYSQSVPGKTKAADIYILGKA